MGMGMVAKALPRWRRRKYKRSIPLQFPWHHQKKSPTPKHVGLLFLYRERRNTPKMDGGGGRT